MRTTITLDDDVAAKLQRNARNSGRSFKDVVNDALRAGLAVQEKTKKLQPFKIKPEHLLHIRPGFNDDKVEELFDQLDTPRRLR